MTFAKQVQTAVETNQISEIYLDLDDVLNTFTSWIGFVFGATNDPDDLNWFDPKCGFDVYRSLKSALGDRFQITEEQLWAEVTEPIWRSVPKSKMFYVILDWAKSKVGQKNVFVATCPANSDSSKGKQLWLEDNLPSWAQRQWNITPCKWQLSAPGRLLIDDSKENCDKWEARGGKALLVRKPWNCADWASLNPPWDEDLWLQLQSID